MKSPRLHNSQHFVYTFVTPVPERIRRFLSATYAANGGPEHMSLNDWIGVDQKVERKHKNECSKTQP